MGALLSNPDLIPLVGIVAFFTTVVAIVGIGAAYRTRAKELEAHQAMRVREMEHERNMKQLELEIEKVRAGNAAQHVA